MQIEQHYKEHSHKFLKRLTFRCGNEWDAQDILHDAYERALKYKNSFNGESFEAWFNTIVNNALKEHKNASKGFATSVFEEEEEEGTPCPQYGEQVLREIHQLIKAKAPVQKEVLSLHFQQDYSAIDISRITEYTYSNCHQIIRRFREELKEKYG